ncbi:MAG TPA: NAD(P)H-dependent oxidoreductase subunit E [Roseiflexaceae bacterium]|nr:NAD(P)H-dependent oxidoreductase subunit E [Roseiflexaceae bacterium]
MHAELRERLAQLEDDLRAGRVERAALFWLKVLVDATPAGEDQLRSDRWVEAGLEAARQIPGLSATALAPRQQLAERYGLLRFVRMKDGVALAGEELAHLDWQRRYLVGLRPELGGAAGAAGALEEVRRWVGERWAELGGVAPEFAALEAALERHRPLGRAGLIETLHDAQEIFGGWLPRPALERVATALGVPQADVQGVVEFYDLFHDRPVGRQVIRVCQDAPCALAGADALLANLCQRLGVPPGETTPDGMYAVEPVRCLGLCDRAPAAYRGRLRFGPLDPAAPEALLVGEPPPERGTVGGMIRLALANVGVVDPTSLEAYRTQGGLAALHQVLERMAPAQVIAEIQASKLVGRGGAAFPAGQKWQLTAQNPAPRYVICNADESEPGAFKDRVLLEGDPFRVLEGLLIACYAVGAARGFVYIRGEYPLAYERITGALRQLEAAGYLGERIMGSSFSCQIEVRRGAGAYICGEETALMESIEGKRGFPRLKPPFPTTAGLWGRPTAINNVETLAKVPPIVLYGSRWYGSLGTADSAGTKLFAVSGSVARPGVYEVPFGVPLRHLLNDLAGGLRPGRRLQAVLTGGAAGTFLTPAQLDTPLSFEDFRRAGGTIGAGTIMVFDDTVDLRDVLARIGAFFAHESCGKCYPCQLGTQRQAEILRRLAEGRARPGDAETLLELGAVMADTSICGLGQTAAMAAISAHGRWPGVLAGGQRIGSG